MSAVPALKRMTIEKYLEMEDASTEKHEFIGGQVYAMAGASFAHHQITSNCFIGIGSFLSDTSCRIYGSDLKVYMKTAAGFVYPDLTIICNGPQFMEGRRDIVTNPSVIIEVLSPDTQNYDHGEKFMLYRQIPTLQEYILVSSTYVLVEKFIRHTSGAWTLTEYKRLDDSFSIDTIHYQTTLQQLYRDVVFEKEEAEGEGIMSERG